MPSPFAGRSATRSVRRRDTPALACKLPDRPHCSRCWPTMTSVVAFAKIHARVLGTALAAAVIGAR